MADALFENGAKSARKRSRGEQSIDESMRPLIRQASLGAVQLLSTFASRQRLGHVRF